jgi:hypothetical protein
MKSKEWLEKELNKILDREKGHILLTEDICVERGESKQYRRVTLYRKDNILRVKYTRKGTQDLVDNEFWWFHKDFTESIYNLILEGKYL